MFEDAVLALSVFLVRITFGRPNDHAISRLLFQNLMIIADNEFIDIPTQTGPMRTYLLFPVAEGRYPGIVLFSEIFQVTGPIRRTAAMLAGHGFVVAVPEIFHELEEPGTVLPYDQAGADRGNADKINKELSSYDADAKAAAAGGSFGTGTIGGFSTQNTGGINNIQLTTGFNNVQQNSVSISAAASFNAGTQ